MNYNPIGNNNPNLISTNVTNTKSNSQSGPAIDHPPGTGVQTPVAAAPVGKIPASQSARTFGPQAAAGTIKNEANRQTTIEIQHPLPQRLAEDLGTGIKSVEIRVSHEPAPKPADKPAAAQPDDRAQKPGARIQQIDLRHPDQTKTELREYSEQAVVKDDKPQQKAASHIIRSVKEFSRETELKMEPRLQEDLTALGQKLADQAKPAATKGEAAKTRTVATDKSQAKLSPEETLSVFTRPVIKQTADSPTAQIKTGDQAKQAEGEKARTETQAKTPAASAPLDPAKQGQQVAANQDKPKPQQEKAVTAQTAEIKEAADKDQTPIKVDDSQAARNNQTAKDQTGTSSQTKPEIVNQAKPEAAVQNKAETQQPAKTAAGPATKPEIDGTKTPGEKAAAGTPAQTSQIKPEATAQNKTELPPATVTTTGRPAQTSGNVQNVDTLVPSNTGKTILTNQAFPANKTGPSGQVQPPSGKVDQFVSTPAKILSLIGQNIGMNKTVDVQLTSGTPAKAAPSVNSPEVNGAATHISINLESQPVNQPPARTAVSAKTAGDQMSPKESAISYLVTEKEADQIRPSGREKSGLEAASGSRAKTRSQEAKADRAADTVLAARTRDRDTDKIAPAEIKTAGRSRDEKTDEKHREEDKQDRRQNQQRQDQQKEKQQQQKKRSAEETEMVPGEALRELFSFCRLAEADQADLEHFIGSYALKTIETLGSLAMAGQKALASQLFGQIQALAGRLQISLGLTLGQIFALIEAGGGALVIGLLLDLLYKLKALLAKLQIFFILHRAELAELGITSLEQLAGKLKLASTGGAGLELKLLEILQQIRSQQSFRPAAGEPANKTDQTAAGLRLDDGFKNDWSKLTGFLANLAKTRPEEHRYQETLKIIIQYLADNNFRIRETVLEDLSPDRSAKVAPVEEATDPAERRKK